MIQLDHRTDNPRHGLSGIGFNSWEEYALTLGYLSNIRHYRSGSGLWDGTLELKFEHNNKQGAWGKEGRIQYYGTVRDISNEFIDLYNCKSAGVGNITLRFNSNGYMKSLIEDYKFETREYSHLSTRDVFPPANNAQSSIRQILNNHLVREFGSGSENVLQIESILDKFDEGWNK